MRSGIGNLQQVFAACGKQPAKARKLEFSSTTANEPAEIGGAALPVADAAAAPIGRNNELYKRIQAP